MEIEKRKARKSPQQKKAESFAFDRRNCYGENDKSSRKAIPARKASESRRSRRKAVQLLGQADRLTESDLDVAESSLRHDVERVGGWQKDADMPLGEFLVRQGKTLG